MLNEKEKDRQEENTFSTLNRISSAVMSGSRVARPDWLGGEVVVTRVKERTWSHGLGDNKKKAWAEVSRHPLPSWSAQHI